MGARMDPDGQVATSDWSVSSVLSHDVLYVPAAAGSVSNFVTPAWFDPLAPATAQFDKLGQLTAPFIILKGGYVVYESAGKEQQKVGDKVPDWRKRMKT